MISIKIVKCFAKMYGLIKQKDVLEFLYGSHLTFFGCQNFMLFNRLIRKFPKLIYLILNIIFKRYEAHVRRSNSELKLRC